MTVHVLSRFYTPVPSSVEGWSRRYVEVTSGALPTFDDPVFGWVRAWSSAHLSLTRFRCDVAPPLPAAYQYVRGSPPLAFAAGGRPVVRTYALYYFWPGRWPGPGTVARRHL